jgi:hypothetical protein
MIAAKTVQPELVQFFEQHRRAVLDDDLEALLDVYSYPVTFCDYERTIVVRDEAVAANVYHVMRNLYEDLGTEAIETRWVVQHRVSSDFVLADVTWRLLDANGGVICDQRSTYALRGDGPNVKIVAVFLHEDGFPTCGTA